MNKIDYFIDDYWRPGDGGVDNPDSPQTDWSLAFKRIVDEVIQREQTQNIPQPLRIQFTGRPIYYFKNPMIVTTAMTLAGTGGHNGSAPILSFSGCPGIIVNYVTPEGGAGHSRIEGFNLRYTQPSVDSGTYSLRERHGIALAAPSFIHDVGIISFPGHGIHAYGNVFATPKSNVNLTNVSYCRVHNCGLSGVYFKGHDANACLIQAVNSSSNGTAEVKGDGYGFFDESALGNTYIACHSYNNKFGGYFCNRDVDGGRPKSYAMLINCYSEGEPHSEITLESLVLSTSDGGLNNRTGNGHVIHTGSGHLRMTGTLFVGADGTQLRVADGAATGARKQLFIFSCKEDPGYQFVYEPAEIGRSTAWSFKHSGSDARTALSLTGTEHPRGPGIAIVPNGLLLGRAGVGSGFRKVIYAPKTSFPASAVPGDIVLNMNPSASAPDNHIGWVCVVGGDNPKWHKFGAIEPTPDTTVVAQALTSDGLVEETFETERMN